VFWLVIAALSMLNFGADLIVAGAKHLSGWDVMVMTGSWLILGGVAILVWTATTRRRLPVSFLLSDGGPDETILRFKQLAEPRCQFGTVRVAIDHLRGQLDTCDADRLQMCRQVPVGKPPADLAHSRMPAIE